MVEKSLTYAPGPENRIQRHFAHYLLYSSYELVLYLCYIPSHVHVTVSNLFG